MSSKIISSYTAYDAAQVLITFGKTIMRNEIREKVYVSFCALGSCGVLVGEKSTQMSLIKAWKSIP